MWIVYKLNYGLIIVGGNRYDSVLKNLLTWKRSTLLQSFFIFSVNWYNAQENLKVNSWKYLLRLIYDFIKHTSRNFIRWTIFTRKFDHKKNLNLLISLKHCKINALFNVYKFQFFFLVKCHYNFFILFLLSCNIN